MSKVTKTDKPKTKQEEVVVEHQRVLTAEGWKRRIAREGKKSVRR